MKQRCKLAVRWSDGSVSGIVGRGHADDHAQIDAYRQTLREAERSGRSFQIASASDVACWPDGPDKESVRRDWERETLD